MPLAAGSSEASEELVKKLVAPRRSVATGAASVAVISSFLFGYSICVLDSCGELIPVVFEWCGSDWRSDCAASRVRQGLVNAAVFLGAAGGAFLAGRPWLASGGSRSQILLSDVLFAAGGLSCASAQGALSLLSGRLVSGIGLGVCAIAAPRYIAEVSPRELRGANSALHGVFITVGILCAITFGFPQSPPPSGPGEPLEGMDRWFWRLLLGFPVLPALAQALLFCYLLPIDPPSFLVLKGRVDEARELLYRSYGLALPEGAAAAVQNSEVASLELQLVDLQEAASNFLAAPRIHVHQAICDPWLRRALLVGFGLAAFQQLCGNNALISYSNRLFAEAGIPPEQLTLASTAMASANVCAALFSSAVADSWGRRKLLLAGPFLQAVSMAVITLGTTGVSQRIVALLTVVCFSLFVVAFNGALGSVTWLYLSEIYPMEIRGPALSACGVINWLSCFVVVFGARFLSLHSSCLLFGAISGVGCLGVYLWVVETSGCDMDDGPLAPKAARSTSRLLTASLPKAFAKVASEEEEGGRGAKGG